MTDLLQPQWLTVVGIGLVAGLGTNAVAIWMVFHPFKPVRFGHIRIFPQG